MRSFKALSVVGLALGVAFTPAARAAQDRLDFTAALQNCTELIGLGPVSFAKARTLVPAAYSLVPFNGSAGIVVRAAQCASVRVDNAVAAPVIVAQIGISIFPPDGTGDINNYQLLYVTNEPKLADALNEAGVAAALDRTLAFEFTPDSTGQGEVYVSVPRTNQQVEYFITGNALLPPPGGPPVVANWWFNGSRRTVKMATSIPAINYGPATFSLHTSRFSLLGELIGGNTSAPFLFFNAAGVFATGSLAVTTQ